jgi:hypothetical protein
MFLGSKLPCLGWISADFLQGFFAQNVCRTCANKRVPELRFIWFQTGLPDFFLAQTYQIGKNMPNDHKLCIPNGH